MTKRKLWFITLVCLLPTIAIAQADSNTMQADTATDILTLQQCIQYAASHQPDLKQSYIDESIAKTNNLIGLSDWMPQVTGTAGLQHYYQLPTAFFPNSQGGKTPTKTGLYNVSVPTISVNQTIFNPDVLWAARSAKLVNKSAKENTQNTKITLISDVSKAFYDLLLTKEQIHVLQEDTARLRKNQQDAYHQYVSGIVDKVDYKQASIALNNSVAQLHSIQENLDAKYAVLKQVMGYPADKHFTVQFDTTQMMQGIYFDTTETLQYDKRIEYQQLATQINLQKQTTAYYQLSFLPSLNAYYNYNFEYENDDLGKLYNTSYPYSSAGLNLSLPIFQGLRRLENIHKAKLNEKRDNWEMTKLKSVINTQYRQALANYKSTLYNLQTMQDNMKMAKEVYDIVKLQYREGVKTYLNVITAESDLRTSEINYLNALFELLSSKIDLQRALGDISPDF